MGSHETEKPVKSEKPVAPAGAPQEQSSVHVYPDWAAVQAYYGPGAIPPPYFNPAVASGHAPHPYMWPAAQMIPPYASPYAAMYSHGGIYAHSAAQVVSTPLSLETPTRSGNDGGSAKKLRESDAPEAEGNGNGESGRDQGQSRSTDYNTEGSYDRSDDSTAREYQNGRKTSYNEAKGVGKFNFKTHLHHDEVDRGNITTPRTKSAGSTPSCALEASDSSGARVNSSAANAVTSVASRPRVNNERENKREKRKQSNRESARRSRLRKQAEMEELSKKVESLTAENMALKSEVNKLDIDSEKLRSENAALMEKLKDRQGPAAEVDPEETANEEKLQVNTENLLSRVNCGTSSPGHEERGKDQ